MSIQLKSSNFGQPLCSQTDLLAQMILQSRLSNAPILPQRVMFANVSNLHEEILLKKLKIAAQTIEPTSLLSTSFPTSMRMGQSFLESKLLTQNLE
jgi:hypothetical protein